ncbi:hypothetical protein PAMP_016835 [Pampus punctatissimus]
MPATFEENSAEGNCLGVFSYLAAAVFAQHLAERGKCQRCCQEAPPLPPEEDKEEEVREGAGHIEKKKTKRETKSRRQVLGSSQAE